MERDGETLEITASGVELLTREAFAAYREEVAGYGFLADAFSDIRYCNANLFGGCAAGTLFIPDGENPAKARLRCGFYMEEDRLLIVEEDGKAAGIFEEIGELNDFEKDVSRSFFEFLQYLIRDDLSALERYEKRLESLESEMGADISELPKDLDRFIARQRRELRRLTTYYKHMAEVADVMEASLTKMGKDRSRQLFAYFGKQVDRLCYEAASIGEYALQIRDMYMSKVNMKQNKVMQLLTIVTTIFMPLTLIAGWYGMNFSVMPELRHPYGYMGACILACVVVIVEIVWFKRKKWF